MGPTSACAVDSGLARSAWQVPKADQRRSASGLGGVVKIAHSWYVRDAQHLDVGLRVIGDQIVERRLHLALERRRVRQTISGC
jgi:hypothetical protein